MKYLVLILFVAFSLHGINAQYNFNHTKDLACTEIKNQSKTGTCWSFATSSFIESELIRMGKGQYDLSEMYVVRQVYNDKANNYIMRQGKANFSQGSLAHDLIRVMDKHGIVTEGAYNGLLPGESNHNHSEMEAGLKGFLDGVIKSKSLSPKWKLAFNAILDAYVGQVPDNFKVAGESYSPITFKNFLGVNADDYVNLSSFTHHPFDTDFVLEIPDNYSNGSFKNIPIDDLIAVIDKAIKNGYSVAWDGDVSEKGFNAKEGIAVLPVDPERKDLFRNPGKELNVNQALRQQNFESYSTTDDHLMHIVGSAKDQKGNEYYIIKNSWGTISPFEGYLYMSKAYAKMKTVAIMVHKDMFNKS